MIRQTAGQYEQDRPEFPNIGQLTISVDHLLYSIWICIYLPLRYLVQDLYIIYPTVLGICPTSYNDRAAAGGTTST